MIGNQALLAVVAVTGIPEALLKETEGGDDYSAFVSNLTGKTYCVESAWYVNRLPEEEKKDMQILGEHEGLYVYEQKAWWDGLL
ncbi:hypothetical protein FHS15_002444 [Paenibacillus castaneae]|uniref:hypothetical protein n=1 Tax=Paenibacillus castaneae TaxID=474957 RepID=UPI000C9A1CBE|nr:hypothetical protein [Paenibacillus castaneae]NIK77308.1 hypothetical protein [Paenibacillus castaneae]